MAIARPVKRRRRRRRPCSSELASMNANLEARAYALAMPAAATTTGTFREFLSIPLSQAVGAAGRYTVDADRASGAIQLRDANVATGSQSGVNFNF